jgi:hypothetical protein
LAQRAGQLPGEIREGFVDLFLEAMFDLGVRDSDYVADLASVLVVENRDVAVRQRRNDFEKKVIEQAVEVVLKLLDSGLWIPGVADRYCIGHFASPWVTRLAST